MPAPRKYTSDPSKYPACVRCGSCYPASRRWPEGIVCFYCVRAARNRQGSCAACGHEGILPGLDTEARPLCVRCCDVPLDVRCKRCGEESLASDSNICWHCLLTDRINKLLAGPDGEIPERLRPLAEAIIGMPRPNSGWAWIHMNRRVPELLRGLSTGDIELSHDALDSLPRSRTIEYLRGLLVAHGCLPWRDEHLIAYGRWLTSKLDTIADIDQRRLIERYTRWHVMRRMRRDDSDQQPSVATILRETGIPAMATRSRAWIQMVREAPPAVLADALGVSPKTAMRYAEQAGTDYLGYANLPRIQKE